MVAGRVPSGCCLSTITQERYHHRSIPHLPRWSMEGIVLSQVKSPIRVSSKIPYPAISATPFIRGSRPLLPDKTNRLPVTTCNGPNATSKRESLSQVTRLTSTCVGSYRIPPHRSGQDQALSTKSLSPAARVSRWGTVAISHRLAARHAGSTCPQDELCMRHMTWPILGRTDDPARREACLSVLSPTVVQPVMLL